MGKKIKRILSLFLTICVLLSCVAVGSFTANAGTSASGIDYGLVDNIQYGNILHCWNWSYNNIRANLQRIAEQGFTAIQTSPLQVLKESVNESWSTVAGQWWTFYQPIGFTVENTGRGLGSKDELIALCNEAHRYNIKVVVDVVFNHLANDYGNAGTIHPFCPDEFKNNMNLWHQPLNYGISNYNNRYDVTHYSLLKLPDLNTGHDTVQWYAGNYLKELIYCGVDGFRFDAAKHIETPSDADGTRSEFWYNVLGTATSYAQSTRGFTPFYYGEILDGTGGVDIGAYTYYMSVTDSQGSENIRNGVLNGDSGKAAQSYISNGAANDRAVLWNESHDEYIADQDYTRTIDSWHLNKTWALTGTRNASAGLYLARPDNTGQRIGVASLTSWTSKEVQAVNQFKNRMAGKSDYLASYGSFAYNVRGGQGAVIVNTGQGNSSAWVSVPSCGMADGTYREQITGNTFTVSGGWLYGDMGTSGIAVVYNKGPEASIHPATTAYRSDTFTLTLHTANADHGRYSFNNYDYFDFYDGQQITIGADKEVGETTCVYIQSVNMWGEYSNLECYYYWKLAPDTQIRVYFQNGSYGYSNPYAYFYHPTQGDAIAEPWPGIKMEYDDNTDLPYADVPMGYEGSYVIISDNGGRQNPDNGYGYKLNGQTVIFDKNMAWDYYPPTTEGISGDIYLSTDTWGLDGAKLMAYVWTGGNNAMATFDLIGENLYMASLPTGNWKHIKFLRINGEAEPGTEWENVWNESTHMIPTGHNYYGMNTGAWDGSGSWGVYDADTGYATSLVGDFNEWDASANVMESNETDDTVSTSVTVDEGSYAFKLVQSRVTTPAAYSMRTVDAGTETTPTTVVETGLWYGSGSTITDTATDVGFSATGDTSTLEASGGTYTFTYDKASLSLDVTYEPAPTEPAPEVGTPSVYTLAGDFNEWDKSATNMTYTEDPNVVATTLTLDRGTYFFKVIQEGLWWFGNETTIANECTDIALTNIGGNCMLEADGGDYTIAYNIETEKLSVSYVPAPEPDAGTESDVYLSGTFNEWVENDAMTYTTGDIVTKTIELPRGEHQFKLIRDGYWYGNEGVIEDTTTTTSEFGWEMSEIAPNCTLKATGGTYTFMYNTKSRMLTVTYEPAPTPEVGSASDVIIAGDFNDWNYTDDTMVYQSDRVVEKTYTLEKGEYYFKIVKDDLWYGNDGVINNTTVTTSDVGWVMDIEAGNCVLNATGGEYTFIYNLDTRSLVINYVPEKATIGSVSPVSLVGSFNEWDPIAEMMKYTSDTTVATTVSLKPGSHEFKIVDSYWFGCTDAVVKDTADGLQLDKEGNNCTLQTTGGDYTFTYDITTHKVTITFVESNLYEIGSESDIVLAGDFNEWSETAEKMLYASNETVTTELELPKGTYQFKVVSDGAWYGNDGVIEDTTVNTAVYGYEMSPVVGNCTLKASGGKYKFTYNMIYNKLTITYVPGETADDIEIGSKSDIALAGTFNEWNPTAEMMKYTSDTTVAATISLKPGSHQFKVVDGFWYGNTDAVVKDTTNGLQLDKEGGNCTLQSTGGDYTFTYDFTTNKVVITFVASDLYEIGSKSDIVLAGDFNEWNETSERMLYASNETVTTELELPKGTYQFKIVSDGFWYGNEGVIEDTTTTTAAYGWDMSPIAGNCTLKASGGKYTFTYNMIYNKLTITYVPGETAGDVEIGSESDFALAGTFNEWNPTAEMMKYTSDTTVATTISLAPGSHEFKVVNGFWFGSTDTVIKDTTKDLQLDKEGGNCTLQTTGGDYTFTYSITTDKLTITYVPSDLYEIGSESDIVLAGDFNEWSETSEKMLYASNETVTTELELPKGTYQFKIVSDGFWHGNDGVIEDTTVDTAVYGYEMSPVAGNCTLKASGGKYTFTYNMVYNKLTITYVPGETAGDVEIGSKSDVALAGTFNEWVPTAEMMTYSADDTVTTTLELAKGTYQFKIVSDGFWYGNGGTIEDTTTTTAAYGWDMDPTAGDCTLKASGGKYTFSFNLDNKKLTITYVAGTTSSDPQVGDESTFALAGDFNEWNKTAQKMTYKSAEVVTTTISLNAGSYGFKIVDELWYGNDGIIEDTTTATSDTGWDMFSDAGNCTLKASGGKYTFDYNIATSKLVVTYVENEVNPNAVVTIAGDFNSWDDSATKLTSSSGNVVTTTLKLTKGEYQFKIVDNGEWYGNNGTIEDTTTKTSSVGWEMTLAAGNCTLNASGGTYTIKYNKATHMLIITKS